MFKKAVSMLTAVLFLMSVPITALASVEGVTTGSVNFRDAPSTSGDIYYTMREGTEVAVLDKVNRYWVKVRRNGTTGYLSTNYIDYKVFGTITSGVNFRSAPSVSDSRIYKMLHSGTEVLILGEVNQYWVKIRHDGQTGYISTNYVRYNSEFVGSASSGSTDNSGSDTPEWREKADRLIAYARRFLGVPYKFGAEYPTSGRFDCSSFTQYVYKRIGINLPRVSRYQAREGRYVAKRNLRKGDLVFFNVSSRPGIDHVGIYAGDGRILHTYGSGGVRYTPLSRDYWENRYVTARRVID